MKNDIILIFLLFSIFSPQFVSSDELPPSYDERTFVYGNGISNIHEEETSCGMAFRGSNYAWIKVTTVQGFSYFVGVTCGNELDESYVNSRVGVALPYSYQFAETGTWDPQKVWSIEFKRNDFPYSENWGFRASFAHEYPFGAEVVFLCYIDNYAYV